VVDDLEAVLGGAPLVAQVVHGGQVGEEVVILVVAQIGCQLRQLVRGNHQAAAVQVGLFGQHCARNDVAVGQGCLDS